MARILIVDDEPSNRLLLVAILEPAGYELSEAADGAAALRQAKEERPDLIITDLNMPGMGGPDFLTELRRDPELKDVKVALYTATAANPDLWQFMETAGVTRIIPKPSDPREVLNVVSAILEGR